MAISRALLSVSDKRGLLPFARTLSQLGVELLSTGGTADLLASSGIPVTKVSDYTGAPEVFGGRVKTLHPKIHGGILYRREEEGDRVEAAREGIGPIDLVVVNLYPFSQTVARGAPFEEIIENIDIGGPSMVRSAAKNWKHVGIVVDPDEYERVAEELTRDRALSDETRRRLMLKAFQHTAAYDSAIANYLAGEEQPPAQLLKSAALVQALRYGENPHQRAALYRDPREPQRPTVAFAKVLGGKELSYNNLLDLDSALSCVMEFERPTAVVVKHNTPCGVASADTLLEAFRRARAADELSAFGGIVALNGPVDGALGEALAETFLEAVLASSFDEAALKALAGKKNLRLLESPPLGAPQMGWRRDSFELRTIAGGLLLQERDVGDVDRAALRAVTQREPTAEELRDALFAFRVVKHVRSNAIVFAKGEQTLGIGGGQTSRVDAVELAIKKAKGDLKGCAVGSDAFFPFRDGIDAAAQAGARCIIQPGGSLRDAEAIAAADEQGIAMLFSKVRHFRH